MIQNMEMDRERLREVLTLSRIGLPEEKYQEVLDRVNEILRLCDKMQELAAEDVPQFEWDVKKAPARRRARAAQGRACEMGRTRRVPGPGAGARRRLLPRAAHNSA